MFQRVLFTTDGSALSRAALEHALRLAGLAAGAVRVLQVRDDALPSAHPDLDGDAIRRALERAGLTRVDFVTLDGAAGATIVADARAWSADVVVMSTHGRSGLSRAVMGSVADEVVRTLRGTPILLLRPTVEQEERFAGPDWLDRASPLLAGIAPYRRVLVALDGSAVAAQILPHVALAVDPAVAAIELLMVIDGDPHATEDVESATSFGSRETSAWIERGTARLEAARAALEASGASRVTARILPGIPERTITAVAHSEGADLIAMATHGRAGIARSLLGSVPDYVLRHCPGRPLLVVRPDLADPR